jgi:hypothetical protein
MNPLPSRVRVLVTLLFLVLALLTSASANEDPYAIREVMQLLGEPTGYSTGISEKQLNRLGDELAIALLKIYSTDELARPANVRKYLPLIQGAFAFRSLIAIPEDREPRVTMFLLEFLQSRVRERELQGQIAAVKAGIVGK